MYIRSNKLHQLYTTIFSYDMTQLITQENKAAREKKPQHPIDSHAVDLS